MDIEKTTDLLDFINYECLEEQVSSKLVFNYFYKCCYKTIIELSDKFKENDELDTCVVMGSRMFFYVFFVLIMYTNNIKLTVFLSERAILLYSEFILMSKDKSISEDLNYTPNISDAISFAYKKTIGPIKISEFNKFNNLNIVRDVCNIVVNLYNIIFLKNKELLKKIDIIDDEILLIINIIFCKLKKETRNYLHIKIINIIEETKNIESTLVVLKLVIDNFGKFINNSNAELKLVKKLFETVYNEYFELEYDYTLDQIDNLKECFIYGELRKSVKIFRKIYVI